MTATIHDLPAPQATTPPMTREEWLLDLGAIFVAYGMTVEEMRAKGVPVFTQMADALDGVPVLSAVPWMDVPR